MKTAISIPDALFDSAEALATELGVSRSQLYATALAQLIATHDRTQITARLDALYGGPQGEPSQLEGGYAALQGRALDRSANGEEDQW